MNERKATKIKFLVKLLTYRGFLSGLIVHDYLLEGMAFFVVNHLLFREFPISIVGIQIEPSLISAFVYTGSQDIILHDGVGACTVYIRIQLLHASQKVILISTFNFHINNSI